MLDAYQSDLDQADDGCLGFDCSIEELEPTKLWLRDDGGFGEIEHVIGFVLRCAEAFDPPGMWGFGWALTCSKPRLDGFGGGAHNIDLGAGRTIVWLHCGQWLATRMDARFDPSPSGYAGTGTTKAPHP